MGLYWTFFGMQLYSYSGRIASADMQDLAIHIDQLPSWLAHDSERWCALIVNRSIEAIALTNLREVRHEAGDSPDITRGLCKVTPLRLIIDAFFEERRQLLASLTYVLGFY